MLLDVRVPVRPVDAQLVLRGRPQPRELVVVVQGRVVQRGERLSVRIAAQILQRAVVLLLRRTLRRVVERGREVGRLEVRL